MTSRLARAWALLLGGWLLVACASTPTSSGERLVASDGVRLRMHVAGPDDAADTVIAVHGGPGLDLESMATYDRLAGAHRRVITYDQRGAGRSTAPSDGNYRLAAQVADLEAVRVASGADRVWLVGESWGGAVAAAYAASHPDRVRGLVLVGAVPLDRAEFRAGEQRFLAHIDDLQRKGLIVRPLPPTVGDSCVPTVRASLPAYGADPLHPPAVSLTSCTASTSRATFSAFRSDPDVERLGALLRDYRGPALVVMGAADAFGLGWLHRVAELLSGATVQQWVVPDAGHVVAAEQPGAFFDRLSSFIAP